MEENKIGLKTVGELLGMNFFIPSYQRGYRWTKQQVGDLLEDVDRFNGKGFYCLQPLVVKIRDEDALGKIKSEANSIEEVKRILKGSWEVIDGQQRLTTIFIILHCLGFGIENLYSLGYETRPDSTSFLKEIKLEKAKCNIDYYHIVQAKETVSKWLKEKDASGREGFCAKLLNNVKFIWYESVDENPVYVFTRLNIGKIPLTDAELIKALFLNSSNFKTEDKDTVFLRQLEIASEWDKMEYALQNDEFWLFIRDVSDYGPTRIDFIFDLIVERQDFGTIESLGDDEHRTFRYFYEYFRLHQEEIDAIWLKDKWNKVKGYFQIFEEWYNDIQLYHYVGFLVEQGLKLSDLINGYKSSSCKNNFKDVYLKDCIKERIRNCNNLIQQYELEHCPSKTVVRPLLLLFNVQTIINQSNELKKSEKYKLPVVYKFPFHLFKKEAQKGNRYGWEIEHIASNAGDLSDEKNKKLYLKSVEYSCSEEVKNKLNDYRKGEANDDNFEKLRNSISEILGETEWTNENKNKLWNFTLLDSATNQGYKNSVFSFKRLSVLRKEQGEKIRMKIKNNEVVIEMEKSIAFVPPCTRNVFSKAYTDCPGHLSSWTVEDAKYYLLNINTVLSEAGFIDNQKSSIEKLYDETKIY